MSVDRLPRKTAFGTVTEAFELALGFPMLLGAFLLVDVLDTLSEITTSALSVVSLLLGVYVGGVAYVYTEAALTGQTVTFGEAAKPVTRRFLTLIGIAVIYLVAVVVGTFLLVLPGVYLGARLILAFPACVLEDRTVYDSLAVGWDVAGGNVLKLVGIFLLLVLAAIGLGLAGTAVGGLEFTEDVRFLLLTAPISAVITATLEIATARVYLENRAGGVTGER